MKKMQITKTVYKFTDMEDINTDIFQKFYENHPDILVEDDNWYEPENAWFEEVLEALGFDVEDIRFCGFYDQGDGLSFKGSWSKDDMKSYEEFKNIVGANTQLLKYYDRLKDACIDTVYIDYDSSSRYCHSGTMISLNYVESDYEAECVQEVVDIARELADEFYKILEETYENLTSEREVLKWVIDNEIIVDENGKIVY